MGLFGNILKRWKQHQSLRHRYISFRLPFLVLALLVAMTLIILATFAAKTDQFTEITLEKSFQTPLVEIPQKNSTSTTGQSQNQSQSQVQVLTETKTSDTPSTTGQSQSQGQGQVLTETKTSDEPYHNWELFEAEYQEMLRNLKIFVYPDAFMQNESSPFAGIFLPHPNPFDSKIGNYFSEHAFKLALLKSPLFTKNPNEAHFFFMPFSINIMRYHPSLHYESSIQDFVSNYTTKITSEYPYWNSSGGADHFYVSCHSVGREAASKHHELHNNAIQVTCSSSYFQRLYISHKDVGLPQVWPRSNNETINPPENRHLLAFFAGRVQNSRIRKDLLDLFDNDTDFHVSSKHSNLTYEEGFRQSKYCLHVKGYEVNTARISDALHYGCVPVIISNYYDLPFSNVLDWSKFSIIVSHEDISCLKDILLSVSELMYLRLFENLLKVREHFVWHMKPTAYDSFYMTAYQLWLKRGLQRLR